jgi:uncharacterized phage protein (TIGR02216 family)
MSRFGEAAAQLSGAASRLLSWAPDAFWNATPAELALALGLFEDPRDGPDAKTIEALRKRFPDDKKA